METSFNKASKISTKTGVSWASRSTVMLGVMMLVHTGLLAWGALRHSPTFDEVAHLPAGIRHVTIGDFRLFRVNPPLVRMIAAIPSVLLGAKTDWSQLESEKSERPDARLDFEIGAEFIRLNGPLAFHYFTLARWICIPFSLLGAWVCYAWATELYGVRSGLVAACLWCFSPTVLGHAQLITPDVPAAATGAMAFYYFWRWLRSYSIQSALAAGVALGIAELTKSTWIIAFALFTALWLLHIARSAAVSWFSPKSEDEGLTPLVAPVHEVVAPPLQGMQLAGILCLALAILNAGYCFNGSLRPLGEYSFISKALNGTEPTADTAFSVGNRFHGTFLEKVPVPFPKEYILGIDFQKRNFENPTQSYLRGELRREGWWYYYLYALGVKSPLGTLLLFSAATIGRLWRASRVRWFDELIVAVPFLVVLWLTSSQTGINKHLRYVMPAIPFALIWTSWIASDGAAMAKRFVLAAVVWCMASTLWIYPHTISYFNELVGGPRNGHAHLINSNVDWGQDLFFLKEEIDRRELDQVGLVFWSNYDPRISGVQFSLPPAGPIERQTATGLRTATAPQPGIYAISVNQLHGYSFAAPDGYGGLSVTRPSAYAYFQNFKPVASIGYSLLLYDISEDDAREVRRRLELDQPMPAPQLAGTLRPPGKWIFFSVLTPDGERFVTGGSDGNIRLWSVATKTQINSFRGDGSGVTCGTISPDGRLLASGSKLGEVRLWNIGEKDTSRIIHQGTKAVECIAFSPDGKLLAAGDSENNLRVWSVHSGELVALHSHDLPLTAVTFSSAGKISCGTNDWRTGKYGGIYLYESPTAKPVKLEQSEHYIIDVQFSPDGRLLVGRTSDGGLGVWNVDTQRLSVPLLSGRSNRPVCFSHDGKYLAAGDSNGYLKLWDTTTWTLRIEQKIHDARVDNVSWKPGEPMLMSSGRDGFVRFWKLALPLE